MLRRPENWIEQAEQDMAECGIPLEIILTRALMLGIEIKPHSRDYSTPANWLAWDSTGTHQVGILGVTPEMTAFRWLERVHPEALNRVAP